MYKLAKSILQHITKNYKPQNPDYHGPYGDIFRALDINRDAGRLVVAI